jgi:hypothetical protein
LLSNWNGFYETLKLILIRLECMCILPGVLKRCTWILSCLVCPIPSPAQICSPAYRWWCGKPATSYSDDVVSSPPQNLTQQSGPITRVASDLGWTCQKYHCTIQCIISLRHLPPRMKNQHGLNEEKTLIRKKMISLLSPVMWHMWLVWILTT